MPGVEDNLPASLVLPIAFNESLIAKPLLLLTGIIADPSFLILRVDLLNPAGIVCGIASLIMFPANRMRLISSCFR